MPSATTFASLQTDLRRYLERGFTEASDPLVFEQLPRLITLAERRIARELKVQGQQNVVTSAFQTGLAVYAKPDRWKETISINFGTGTGNNTRNFLFTRDYEYLTAYWPDRTVTGVPQFYADYDYEHFIVAPTPAAASPFEMLYYQLLPLLDDATQTNWLTEFAPDLLLYASLLEAEPYLKNDARVAVWQAFYDRTASAYDGENMQKILDRAAARGGKA